MLLEKIKIRNFKSFGSVEIPLKEGFTAVIGPNGSGKSNLMDAILFVLGETSLKKLRVGKLTELIHNRSKPYAKVELEIKDRRKKIKLSRIILENGKTICKIDDKKVSLNELVTTAEELGLKKMHNFIAQGYVTAILEMSDEERRKLIDEIAGISEFEEKRKEALANLEKVEKRVREIRLVLNERFSTLKELRKEAEMAKRYELLQKRRKEVEAGIIAYELETANRKKQLVSEKIAELNEELRELEEKRESVGERIEISEQNVEKLRLQAMELQERISNKNVTLGKLEEAKKRLKEEIGRALKELSKFEENYELEEKLHKKIDEKNKLMEEIKELRIQLDKFNVDNFKYEKMQNELEKKSKELENLNSEIYEIRKEIIEKTAKNEKVKEYIEKIKEKIEMLEKEVKTIESKRNLANKLKVELAEIAKKRKELEMLKKKQASLEAELEELRKRNKELERINAKCPVCDSKISEEKKRKLLEKRKEIEAELSLRIESIESRIMELENELRKYEERKKELEKVKVELEILKEKEKELKSLKNELEKSEKSIENVEKFETQLEKKLKKAKLIENDIEKLRKGISELRKRKQEYERILSELEKKNIELKRIEAEENTLKEALNEVKKLKERSEALEAFVERKERELESIENELSKTKNEIRKFFEKKKSMDETLSEEIRKMEQLKEIFSDLEEKIKSKTIERNELRYEIAKLEVRISDLSEEMENYSGITPERGTKSVLQEKLEKIKKELESLGSVNQKAEEKLSELEVQIGDIEKKLNTVEREREKVLQLIENIEAKKKEAFYECFDKIKENFERIFKEFFFGKAKLSLSSENISEAGLIIEAAPKGRFLNINAMSGGEKALTALAFVFALALYRPAALYVLDEADSALDEINSKKVAKMLREISKKAQIISITHNPATMELANSLIGVTMNKNGTSIVAVKNR